MLTRRGSPRISWESNQRKDNVVPYRARHSLKRAGLSWGTRGLIASIAIGGLAGMGTGLAAGANAATWQDTSIQASGFTGIFQTSTRITGTASDSNGIQVVNFTGLAPAGGSWALISPSATDGVTLSISSGGQLSGSGSAVTLNGSATVKVSYTDSAGDAAIVTAPVVVNTNSVQTGIGLVVTDEAAFSPTGFGLATDDNANGNVAFHAIGTSPLLTFSASNLPGGLSDTFADNELAVAGDTAAPGLYHDVKVMVKDSAGAIANATLTLKVNARPVFTPGNYGDNVNGFGNGWDVYQQNGHAGALVVGWTATKADPATHFIRNSEGSDWQFEYAPSGAASGLCVSDPAGGWSSDPLPDGLILTSCNLGNFQKFSYDSITGFYKDVATGLIVNPNGTGSQLRGGVSAVIWGGSDYSWKDYAHLPA